MSWRVIAAEVAAPPPAAPATLREMRVCAKYPPAESQTPVRGLRGLREMTPPTEFRANAHFAHDLPSPDPSPAGPDWTARGAREFFEERSAIREYDGTESRHEAEARAFGEMVGEFLAGCDPENSRAWRNVLAAALGWTIRKV